MWYKLNEMMGLVLLVAVIGGAAIYGLVLIIEAPPLLHQESDGPNAYQRQAEEDLRKRLREIQDQHDKMFEEAAENRDRALSS